jgi:hypothetical protein
MPRARRRSGSDADSPKARNEAAPAGRVRDRRSTSRRAAARRRAARGLNVSIDFKVLRARVEPGHLDDDAAAEHASFGAGIPMVEARTRAHRADGERKLKLVLTDVREKVNEEFLSPAR